MLTRAHPPAPPPDHAPEPLPAVQSRGTGSFERATVTLARLALLGAAGGVLLLSWGMLWPLSYRLTHGNAFTYTYLTTYTPVWERLYDLLVLANTLVPGFEPPQSLDVLVNALVATFLIGSLGYLGGLFLLDRGIARGRAALGLVLGVTFASQVILFLMPGLFTTDIFSYVMYGHISAIYDLNPYIYPPDTFPSNPMLDWIHPIWRNTPSVYGPLWTNLGWLVARLTAGLPLDQVGLLQRVFAYKLLMNGVYLANLGVVWWLLGRFRPDGGSSRGRLTAFAVFAWNPLLLFEVAGNAHNDGLMVTFLLLGMVPLALLREPRAGQPGANLPWLLSALGLALSALVKYTTGLAGLFLAVAWARRLAGWRARALWLSGTALLASGVTLVVFWPWLQLPEVLDPMLNALGGQLYSNSLPDLAALTIADQVIDPLGLNRAVVQESARFWMKVVTRALFAGYLAWEARRVWRLSARGSHAAAVAVVEASARAFLVLLVLVLTWVLSWYFSWPLALTTLLGWRHPLTRVAVGFTITSLPVFYVHHYWSVNMPGALLFLYVVPPLLVPLGLWFRSRVRRRPSPA